VTHDLVSATVFGNDARLTDAWATALLCMGKKDGERAAIQEDLEVFFIRQQEGKLVESASPALQKTKAVKIR
jgi:thiamine biosynthesis lipoprotein